MSSRLGDTALEQLVSRIHKLIEPAGAKVTWNARLPDPTTGQSRQIDVLIEQNGIRIHAECRDQKAPQDVKWIEELMGRRDSLKVDAIIAVSSSGFTKPAVVKADTHGIFTRQLDELTNEEIEDWAKTAKVTLRYVKIEHLQISALILDSDIGKLTENLELRLSGPKINPLKIILNHLMQESGDQFSAQQRTTVNCSLNFPALQVDDAPVLEVRVCLTGTLCPDVVDLTAVRIYGSPASRNMTGDTFVETHNLGNTEIIQKGDSVRAIVDLSQVAPPRNCYLLTSQIDFGRVVNAKIKCIGIGSTLNFDIDHELQIQALADD